MNDAAALLGRDARPRWDRPWLFAGLAVVLAAPSLVAGWIADDLVHAAAVAGGHPFMRGSVWDLFDFVPGQPGQLSALASMGYHWWMAPDVKLSFLRPLTAATHLLDHALFGAAAWAHHAHTLAWAAAAALVVRALLGRLLPPAIAAFAALLWVVDDARWLTSTWNAARNANVALVFAGLGLLAWWRGVGVGQWRYRWAAPLLLLAALAAGEAALGMLPLWLAWALVRPGGAVADELSPPALADRLRSLLPLALPLGLWAVVWLAGGYGARDSAAYIDPVRQPLAFAAAAVWRLPVLIGAQIANLPPDVATMRAGWRPAMALAGLGAAVALWVVLRRQLRHAPELRPAAIVLALGGLGALIPTLATLPSHRLLGASGVGVAGLLALSLHLAGAGGRVAAPAPWPARALRALHLPLAALSAFAHCTIMTTLALAARGWDEGPALADCAGKIVVPVVGPDLAVGTYPAFARVAYGAPKVQAWWMLAPQRPGLVFERLDAHTLRATSPEVPLFGNEVEGLLCSIERLPRRGEVRRLPGLEVTVEDVADADARLPGVTAARFRFDAPLEDGRYCWLSPLADGWERWTPVAVGARWQPPQILTFFGVPPADGRPVPGRVLPPSEAPSP